MTTVQEQTRAEPAPPTPTMAARRRRAMRGPLALVGTVLVIVLVYGLVDRPAATLSHDLFRGARAETRLLPWFIALTHLVDPLVPLAAFGFVVTGVLVIGADDPRPRLRALFAACAATLIAITVKDELKYAFGRVWPETWINNNPSWIANGAFGFSPFHGGAGWSSFPSGHMTVITAPMVVAMLAWPAWRPLAAVPIVLVAVGLYGADYHFASDMLAGLLLGTICALIVWPVVMGGTRLGRQSRAP